MLSLNQLKKLYINSPLWLQKIYASTPYDLRNGAEYRRWKHFLKKEISNKEYQLFKTKETILYAYENTEYYKKKFDEQDISPFDIRSLKDVSRLPLIDKTIVKENFDKLRVKSFPSRNTFFVTTGGTTGDPMTFLQSKNVWKKELAFTMHYFSQFGYNPSMPKASFRGGTFSDLPKNTYWKFNPIYNEIHFSPFHMSNATIEYYMDALNEKQPKFFHSYPSSLLSLIGFASDKKLSLRYKPKAIFLISENFTLQDIDSIKSFFHCPVSSFYGHTERLIFAPDHNGSLNSFSINSRYGLFELIDSAGSVIDENGISGEMVGSSFDNLAMPLIRYKTGDFTHYIHHDQQIIASIQGRWSQEYLSGKDGEKIYLTALNMHSDIFQNVIKYQFYQKKPGYVELHIVVTSKFQKNDYSNILSALKKKAGHAIIFMIKIVDKLELTKQGKFKSIAT